MFTDIQGYTAIMQRNEDEALKLRNKHREVFQRETARHHGDILQYYGDGTLSVFDSAVDAVKCAIEIQRALQEEPVVPVRIGIHSGDIIFTKEDIIGDGVNVASRVESLSVAGGVLISDKVYDEVKNNSFINTQFLKSFKLKNVGRPLDVYAVTNPGLVIPSLKDISGKLEKETPKGLLGKPLAGPIGMALLLLAAILSFWIGSNWQGHSVQLIKKKVAILPLEDRSLDDDKQYFLTGMTSELINELSKVDALTVIGQASTQVMRAGILPLSSFFSGELDNIDYFVQGSLTRESNQIQAVIKLKQSLEAEPIWENSYSRDLSEARPLWAEVAADLAVQMKVKVKPDDAALWSDLRPVNPETYEFYLKGVHFMNGSTPADWQRGLVYLQEALDRNPADPYAYAWLAEGYIRLGHGPAPPPDVFPKALEAARRAIQLDSTLAHGWAALAHYHTYFGWDWDLAEYAFNRANELNPNLAYNHYHRAWYLTLFGRMNEAIEEHKRAKELDPFTPLHTAWLGELYRMVGHYEEGLAEVGEAMQMQDNNALGLLVKGFILRDQGRLEEAIEAHRQAAAINPGWRYIGLGPTLIRAGKREEGRAIIQELEGMPPTPYGALCLGTMYAELGNNDKAIEWLNFKEKHGWYPWIRVLFATEKLRKDPRFLKLIRDMHLPDPAPLQYDLDG